MGESGDITGLRSKGCWQWLCLGSRRGGSGALEGLVGLGLRGGWAREGFRGTAIHASSRGQCAGKGWDGYREPHNLLVREAAGLGAGSLPFPGEGSLKPWAAAGTAWGQGRWRGTQAGGMVTGGVCRGGKPGVWGREGVGLGALSWVRGVGVPSPLLGEHQGVMWPRTPVQRPPGGCGAASWLQAQPLWWEGGLLRPGWGHGLQGPRAPWGQRSVLPLSSPAMGVTGSAS